MEKLQNNVLRKIRKEFDYESYAYEHYKTKNSNRVDELRACCPSCDETRFRLYINNNKKLFNCYNCGFSNGNADVFDLVALTEGISRAQAMVRLVREYADVTPDDVEAYLQRREEDELVKEEEPPIRTIESLPKGAFLLEDPTVPSSQPFWNYLFDRGFTQEEILDMRTHYVPRRTQYVYRGDKKVGNIGRRIMWPVYGGDNELVSWLSRIIEGDSKQKYLNCPGSDLAKTLWPYAPPPANCKEAVVVEGIIDCLALRRAGIIAYATFGKKLSTPQSKLLKDWGITDLVIFYDVDAKKDIKRLVEDVKMQYKRTFVVDYDDDLFSDPGDLLVNPEGCAILQSTLFRQRIDVYSLDYEKWALE